MSKTGRVFNIERYAVHDGPGIRTLVFLKGCPLRCLWCCNPESQRPEAELLLFPENCIGCGACVESCPNGALSAGAAGIVTDAGKCTLCGACTRSCYSNARTLCGGSMTVDAVMDEVRKDLPFYRQSGGGVTISGGEPFFQFEFAGALLRKCRELAIHTAAETCGYVPEERFKEMMPLVDTYLFDLKHMDPEVHTRLTGVGNERIHRNFDALLEAGKRVVPRMPLIPTLNDTEESLYAVCAFLKKRSLGTLNLLPYHELGVNKYTRVGKEYTLNIRPHTVEEIAERKRFIESQGIACSVY